jgi:hypothetical protein
MDINILVERDSIRAYTSVNSEATRIPGIHKTHWIGPRTRNYHDYYSLTHVGTGRALNKVPLTDDECDRLVDSLIECQIEWDNIVDARTAREYYAGRLTDEASRLGGRF